MVPFKAILLFSFVSKGSTIDKYTAVSPMGFMSVNIVENARMKKQCILSSHFIRCFYSQYGKAVIENNL